MRAPLERSVVCPAADLSISEIIAKYRIMQYNFIYVLENVVGPWLYQPHLLITVCECVTKLTELLHELPLLHYDPPQVHSKLSNNVATNYQVRFHG